MLLSRISMNVVDLDIFHQMALIRESIALGHIPTVDRFAYTATLPYTVHHEWGAGVIAYFVSTWFGAPGLLLLRYSLAAVVAWLCIGAARSRNANFLPAFGILAPFAILFVGHAFSPVRAHLYSLVFVACLFYLLERDRAGDRRWIAIWLPLSVLWVNLHAGFVLGIIMIGVYWLEQLLRGERCRPLPLVAAAMALLVAVNPYGIHYYEYLWRGLSMSRPGIAEWSHLWEAFPSFNAVAFLFSLLPVLYAQWKTGFRAMPGLAIVCVAAVESAMHVRMLPFYAVAWICYVPGYVLATPAGAWLRALFDRPPRLFQFAWVAFAMFFLNVTITYRPWNLEVPGQGEADAAVFPTGAVEYLSSRQFHGNVMAPFAYGAYVTWKMYPAVRVAIDSRYEAVYPNDWVEETFGFYQARPGWKQTLTSYPTDVVLVRKTEPLSQAMRETEWRRVYADGAYEAYARPGLELNGVDRHDQVSTGRFP
jgi:hypothetical protein